MSGSYELRTQNGFEFFEVTSALQKTIRRGLDEEAVYWAFEMVPRYENYLWRRLKVIAHEDIGIASIHVFAALQAMAEAYWEFREKKDSSCTLVLTNAVVMLCRAQKTRLSDHLTVMMENIKGREIAGDLEKRKIPDFAFDMHTRKGKGLGRGLEHFRTEGSKLAFEDKSVADPWEERCYEMWKNPVKWPLEWYPPKGQPTSKAAGPKKDENGGNGSPEGTPLF